MEDSSPPLEVKEFLTIKYMTGFRCIGSECEDDCCHYWKVFVDETHYNMLKERMSTSSADREKFQASVDRNKNPENSEQYAVLKLRPDGNCSFLNKDGLCIIHRDYGGSFLSNACASYPRNYNIVGQRVELAAKLSCPETARQCLLAEDATELVKIDPKSVPQNVPASPLKLPNTDPFLNYVDVVRYTVLKLLSLREYRIDACLFFCVYFANRISSFYYKNTTNFSEDNMVKEISHIENPEVLDELYRKYNAMKIPDTLAMTIIQLILVLHIKSIPNNRFRQLLLDCLKSYQVAGDVPGGGQPEMVISYEKLWTGYEERKSYWESTYGERIDIYFANYCRNSWIQDLYINSTDLLTHFRILLVHFTALRFLFYSHPDLENLRKTLNDTSVEKSVVIDNLDKVIVSVTYLFTKHTEHNKQFIEDIQKSLDEQDIKSFAHLVFLLKF